MKPPVSGLRVLFVAPVDHTDFAHNALRCRAFERLGVNLLHLDPHRAGWLERLVRRDLDRRLESALDQHRPDVVVVAGQGIVPPEAIDRLRPARPVRWVLLLGESVTDVRSAATEAMVYSDAFVGATGILSAFDRHAVKHAHYLAVGCDPSVHKPLRARGPFRANVVFAGAATPRREQLLSELVEFGLAIWGPGWRKTSLRDYSRGELPNTEDFVRAYAGATVAVNIHRSGAGEKGGDTTGVNRRTFELAAIGLPQVVDTRGDLPRHFEDGSEMLVYNGPDQLKGQVKRALHEDKYRERLAGNARQRALREHTYMHRTHELLTTATSGSDR